MAMTARRTLLLTAGAAVVAAGSLLGAAAPVELVVWHGYRGDEKAAFEKVVAAYNSSRAARGVKATTLAVPYDAYPDKISATVPRGKGPDIFIYAQDRLGGWVEAGNTIEPIGFYVDAATRARFLPATLEAMTYRGEIYGLPLNYKVIAMIYNRKLVTRPPATGAELVKVAKALTDASAGRFGLAYWYSNFYYHAPLMNAFGGGAFDASRKPRLNGPENIRSLDLLMKWVDKDRILPAESSTALVTSLFNEGKAAIVFSGPWFVGEIASRIDFGLAPLPRIEEAGGQPMRPWMSVEGVYIARPSTHKDEAYDLVGYLTDFPAAKVLAVEGRQTPANQKVYDDPAVGGDPILKVFRQQAGAAVPMPNYLEMTMVWSPVSTAMNSIVQRSATPKAAMDTAQREVELAIQRLRK
jgi:arabinogalactan oligomer/maltooligosaccharide transport system substrate-binding protein